MSRKKVCFCSQKTKEVVWCVEEASSASSSSSGVDGDIRAWHNSAIPGWASLPKTRTGRVGAPATMHFAFAFAFDKPARHNNNP